MKLSPIGPARPAALLARLIDSPDLVQTVRALPPPTFSALVRHVGVEDAGELVALATTEQLVAAFDEDLFVNERPGQRETFDAGRFVAWLEVLLEAGDEVAARRVAELSPDFVVMALSSVVLVLDNDALLARLGEGGRAARAADKALESCLSEEIDGYLLISRRNEEGWDAALALVLALDRDHRDLLVRVLDRCAEVASGYIDDLEELATVLSAADSLAEDVEAEREERRARRGHVEPRAARSFLALARKPLEESAARDAITRAYFRDLEPAGAPASAASAPGERLAHALGEVGAAPPLALPAASDDDLEADAPLLAAMHVLAERAPEVVTARTSELAYLANVIHVGAAKGDGRFTPAEAAAAALATVELGAALEARERSSTGAGARRRVTAAELAEVLHDVPADVLFRRASAELVGRRLVTASQGFLRSRDELEEALRELQPRGRRER